MNEAVMAVLIYMFENKMQDTCQLQQEKLPLVSELREAGFEQDDINSAFTWLDHLTLAEDSLDEKALKQSQSIRIYAEYEYKHLGTVSCAFITFLQALKILNAVTRELVIDCLFAMHGEISLADVKWAVLMVLFHRPEEKEALQLMEDLVLQEGSDELH